MQLKNKTRFIPKYKDLKFDSNEAFEKWLKETTWKQITFEDQGQDFLNWWIAHNGEVIHSDAQSFVWNGCFVFDIDCGKCPRVINPRTDIDSRLNYKVVSIKSSEPMKIHIEGTLQNLNDELKKLFVILDKLEELEFKDIEDQENVEDFIDLIQRMKYLDRNSMSISFHSLIQVGEYAANAAGSDCIPMDLKRALGDND